MLVGITGATGFIGMVHVAKALKDADIVRVLVRPGHPWASEAPPGIEVVVGDLASEEALLQFGSGLDVCFHYAARASFKGDWEQFQDVNIEGTRRLLEACADVPRFIFCSTQAVVLEDRDVLDGDETLPYPDTFTDHYARSKAEAEQLVLREHAGATVLRPPWVWGAGDTNNLPTLLRPSLNGRIAYFAGGKNQLETVHALNFVQGAQACVATDKTKGKIYFVTDESPVLSGEFSNAILEACGLEANKRSLPAAMGRALAWSGKRDPKGNLILPRSSFLYMVRHQVLSDETFRVDTGYTSSVSRFAGLQDLESWARFVGGPKEIAVGRRRGASRSLVDLTWDFLMNESSLF